MSTSEAAQVLLQLHRNHEREKSLMTVNCGCETHSRVGNIVSSVTDTSVSRCFAKDGRYPRQMPWNDGRQVEAPFVMSESRVSWRHMACNVTEVQHNRWCSWNGACSTQSAVRTDAARDDTGQIFRFPARYSPPYPKFSAVTWPHGYNP
ncbi:unnamed protein product [Soboliphyme baturini]|uniref:Protein Wnt n=1 Tax=Soboliphyme baturini TaxID=241478 RepID=A0A183IPB8_9BILA|nr:unnamed protein product [Soboliphyme baturini]